MRVSHRLTRRFLAAALLLPALVFPVGCSPQAEKATGSVLMTLGTAALAAEPGTGSALLGAGGVLVIHGAHREGEQGNRGGE